ncbi:hypothetical protein ZHAS_00018356 [Anopheles sinensis]|uniref:Uncharacterized protein n=1 Tax=Anopheles sinensis TaxID=74873 RepID=A0A084WJ83_ANOSI|nr:hypothetical protein ZHAS_00018356 [Anopheles sinensis]
MEMKVGKYRMTQNDCVRQRRATESEPRNCQNNLQKSSPVTEIIEVAHSIPFRPIKKRTENILVGEIILFPCNAVGLGEPNETGYVNDAKPTYDGNDGNDDNSNGRTSDPK